MLYVAFLLQLWVVTLLEWVYWLQLLDHWGATQISSLINREPVLRRRNIYVHYFSLFFFFSRIFEFTAVELNHICSEISYLKLKAINDICITFNQNIFRINYKIHQYKLPEKLNQNIIRHFHVTRQKRKTNPSGHF